MPQNKKKSSTDEDMASGFATLKELAAKSAKKSPPKATPPDVDTGSFGGLVKSLKDRASYAIWGPPKKGEKQ